MTYASFTYRLVCRKCGAGGVNNRAMLCKTCLTITCQKCGKKVKTKVSATLCGMCRKHDEYKKASQSHGVYCDV